MPPYKSKHLTCRVTILLTVDELEKLRRGLEGSTCWNMSEYGRKLILGRPVTVFYRNKSLDDFIQEAIALRRQINEIWQAASHSQEVHPEILRLHEEIKNCLNKIFDHVCQNKTQ